MDDGLRIIVIDICNKINGCGKESAAPCSLWCFIWNSLVNMCLSKLLPSPMYTSTLICIYTVHTRIQTHTHTHTHIHTDVYDSSCISGSEGFWRYWIANPFFVVATQCTVAYNGCMLEWLTGGMCARSVRVIITTYHTPFLVLLMTAHIIHVTASVSTDLNVD